MNWQALSEAVFLGTTFLCILHGAVGWGTGDEFHTDDALRTDGEFHAGLSVFYFLLSGGNAIYLLATRA